MTYINAELRQSVIERAGDCCEYCRISQEDNRFTFHVDHIISEKHEGVTEIDNLCLSCPYCNTYKGSDIGSIDRETSELTSFFNPRIHYWNGHFELDGASIEPLTPEGRVTVRMLRLNSDERLMERDGLLQLGRYPC
jgi:hypothetical protein